MASSIINWIIEKYLSNILEINKDLTKSSIFTGEMQMANLKIKPEIFTLLNLPFFELVHGYVGKLRIKAKMPRIHLHPIKVEVENVFFHAKQKKLSHINKEGEIKFMELFKNNQLMILESLKNEVNSDSEDKLNADMLSKIINNIEINISNICIRFDDDISYELTPFCFGVLIKNIIFKTVDENFKEVEGKYSIEVKEINNKIIKIDNFAVYLDTFEYEGKLVDFSKKIIETKNTIITDEKFKTFLGPMLDYYRYCLTETYEHIYNYNAHNYIMFNLNFVFKVSIHEKLKKDQPKFAVKSQMDNIKVELSLVQIKTIMKLSIYQNLMLKYQSGLSKEYYVKKLSEEEKMAYIDNYINYLSLLKKNSEKKANKIKTTILNKVEEGLKYLDIQLMRNAAESKIPHIEEMVDIDKQLKEMKKEKIFRKISFKKKSQEEKEEKEKEKMKQIEELEHKKSELEQKASDSVQNSLSHIELLTGLFPDASGDINLLTMNLEIPEIQFSLKRNQEEKLFTMILTKYLLSADVKNRKQTINMTINDMSLMQYQLPESKYHMIMTTVQQKNEKFNEDEKEEINACNIEFSNDPELEKSNFKIRFRNQKRIIIIVNIYSLQYIGKKLADYMTFFIDKNFDFPEKYNCSGEIYKLIKDGFKFDSMITSYQHFNADLDVTIKSPILLFPIDILDNLNKKCILIRCGDFHVTSELPPREDKNINYAEIKERNKLIDTYKLKSEKLCVTTLDNFDGDLSRLLDAQGLNLIEDVSFDLFADIMFAKNNPFFERFKVGMNVGKCRVNIRDIQLPFFMELIEKSGKLIKLAIYKLENKTYFEKKEIKFNKEEEETYNINNKKKLLNDKNEEPKKEEEKNEEEKNKEKDDKINEFKLDDFIEEDEKVEIKNDNEEIKEDNLGEKGEKNENKEMEFEVIELNEKENINNIVNNEIIIKKEEEQIKENTTTDSKLLVFNFCLEEFQFCLQKTISFSEKQILLKANDENYKNLIYRDFIVFEMNTFKIKLLLSEKLNANATLLIKSIGVIDKETLITNENNPKGELYVDKEFQHIIKMDSGDNKNENDRTWSSPSYRLSSEYSREDSIAFTNTTEFLVQDNNNNINNEDDNDKLEQYFMILNFEHNNEAQTQNADVLLKKIKVCVSMSTMGRLLQFSFYYLEK